MHRVMVDSHRPSKELLLQPLPLMPSGPGGAPAGAGGAGGAAVPKFGKRTTSFTATAPAAAPERGVSEAGGQPAAPSAAAKKLPPKLSVALPTPQLPGNFPATPTAHMALAGGLHKERNTFPVAASGSSSGGGGGVTGASGSSMSAPGSSGSGATGTGSISVDRDRLPAYGLHSPLPGSSGSFNRFAADRASFSSGGAEGGGGSMSGGGGSPSISVSGAAKRLSHLSEVGHAGDPLPAAAHSPPKHTPTTPHSPSAAGGASGSPLRPSLKVALPTEADFELSSGGSGDIMYSPSTPAGKSGMKERMKFYFQRQAGQAGGL